MNNLTFWDLFLYFPDQIALLAVVLALISGSVAVVVYLMFYRVMKRVDKNTSRMISELNSFCKAARFLTATTMRGDTSAVFKNIFPEEDDNGF